MELIVFPQPMTLHIVPCGAQDDAIGIGLTYWLKLNGVSCLKIFFQIVRLEGYLV